MDAVKVAEVFPPLMTRDFDMLQEDWPTAIKPTHRDRLRHRRGRPLVPAPGQWCRRPPRPWTCWACPPERVPISVDHYGNTSAASTLILLDEDRRAGRVHDGDLVVFLWIGAGNGAMNGYAALLL